MGDKIITQNYRILPLELQYFSSYLEQFSAAVCEPLRVKSIDAEREYLHVALEKQVKGETHFYLVVERQFDRVIGAVEIRDPEQSRGQLYTWLNERYWGTGIFQEVIREVAADYFTKTQARYFDATVEVNNVRSYRALKKAGFADLGIQEGAWGRYYVLVLRNKKFDIANGLGDRMKLKLMMWCAVALGINSLQAMEVKKLTGVVLKPFLTIARRGFPCSVSTDGGSRGVVRERKCGAEQGLSDSSNALNTIFSDSTGDIKDGERVSSGGPLSENEIVTLRNEIDQTFNEEAPKQYKTALILAGRSGKKARRRSIKKLEAIAFDPAMPTWVQCGASNRVISMLVREEQTNTGLYNRLFYPSYGTDPKVKEWIKTFYVLYEKYVCTMPASVRNPLTIALARYQAAKAINELKQLRADICDKGEFDQIQQVLSANRAILVKAGVLSPEAEENVSQMAVSECSESCKLKNS